MGHGRYGSLDVGNSAEVPGMAQKREEGLHLDSEGRKEVNKKIDAKGGWRNILFRGLESITVCQEGSETRDQESLGLQ